MGLEKAAVRRGCNALIRSIGWRQIRVESVMKNVQYLGLVLMFGAVVLLGGCGSEEAPEDSSVDSEEAFLEEVRTTIVNEVASSEAGMIENGKGLPIIELETQNFEMGVIANDRIAHAEMKIYNRGTAPLRIGKITTSCGCTTGNMRNDVILPGETGYLEIHVDPAKIPGYFVTKTLTVPSNDPTNVTLTVRVATHVEPELELEPPTFELGEIPQGVGAKGVIHARQLQEATLEFKAVAARQESPYLTAKLEELPEKEWKVPGKREYLIHAELSPDAPAGTYNDVLYLRTNLKRQPTISLRFKAVVHGIYSFSPTRVSLRNVELGQTYEGVLSIVSEKPLEVIGVRNLNKSLHVTHRPGKKANTYLFDVVVPEYPDSRLQRDTWTIDLKADGEEFTENIAISLVLARQQ